MKSPPLESIAICIKCLSRAGGIATGLLSDVLNARALSCVVSLILAVPSVSLFLQVKQGHNLCLISYTFAMIWGVCMCKKICFKYSLHSLAMHFSLTAVVPTAIHW